MSASPVARQVVSSAIPVSRRVVVNHEHELPNDLSSTPGGSLFSTTPGGTRVYYDRSTMLSLRSSPLARTPPANLPHIKGVTVPRDDDSSIQEEEDNYVDSDDDRERRKTSSSTPLTNGTQLSTSPAKDSKDDEATFEMEL